MKKILITGCNGQIGTSLRRELMRDSGLEATYTDIDRLDITNAFTVDRFISDHRFDYIINCAAYTDVDKAEKDAIKAAIINTNAVGNIAQAALRVGAKVIHISSNLVFSGQHFRPYEENDEPYPQSIYGRTKFEGEALLRSFCQDAMIIRTGWIYSEHGNNFVKDILALSGTESEISAVVDQIGSPTYAADLAHAIHTIINSDKWVPGVFHYTNEGVTSWYDIAKAVMEIAGKDVNIKPIPTSARPTAAKRPPYSLLSKAKIKTVYGLEIPYWRDSLRECVNKMT